MAELNPDGTVSGMVEMPTDTEIRAQAVAHCDLCDELGYRGTIVCDHIDHSAANERGRALVLAELEKIRRRRSEADS